jgi:hypothetical protein
MDRHRERAWTRARGPTRRSLLDRALAICASPRRDGVPPGHVRRAPGPRGGQRGGDGGSSQAARSGDQTLERLHRVINRRTAVVGALPNDNAAESPKTEALAADVTTLVRWPPSSPQLDVEKVRRFCPVRVPTNVPTRCASRSPRGQQRPNSRVPHRLARRSRGVDEDAHRTDPPWWRRQLAALLGRPLRQREIMYSDLDTNQATNVILDESSSGAGPILSGLSPAPLRSPPNPASVTAAMTLSEGHCYHQHHG